MFTIQKLVQPDSLAEAYHLLTAQKNNVILGSCAFLRLGSQRIGTAIDLSRCALTHITETEQDVRIGAMATLRDLETSPTLHAIGSGVIPGAVSHVVGVQFRNSATIGGSVFSKYGFSDLLPPLLALDTEVQLHQGGRMALADFLLAPYRKDILTEVIVRKTAHSAAYQQFRTSHSDFPLLNVAVSANNGSWRIVVGARPGQARFAASAAQLLSSSDATGETIDLAAHAAADELSFGTNSRASAAYRKALCPTLVRRAVLEVLSCK